MEANGSYLSSCESWLDRRVCVEEVKPVWIFRVRTGLHRELRKVCSLVRGYVIILKDVKCHRGPRAVGRLFFF